MAPVFTLKELAIATGGVLRNAADPEMTVSGISTDTRTIVKGEAFFALIGENHDAHDHLSEAAGKGAALLAVSNTENVPKGFAGAVLSVSDTLLAYQSAASYYLKRFQPLVIAVTGSVGKTTLKDMIACILSGKVKTYCNQGNLNNQVGLPRTILETDEDIKALVLEMGLAAAGDIERLAGIARPKIAVITNIGVSHRENFDSDDGILKAKYEVAAFLGKGDALVIDSGGNEALARLAEEGSGEKGFKLLRVCARGSENEKNSDYIVSKVRVSKDDAAVSLFEIENRNRGPAVPFRIPVPGPFAGISAALAAAVSAYAGNELGAEISLADSAAALALLKRTPHRLEPALKNGILVIDDTYNASPDSAKAGLLFLESTGAKRRVAVLADMNELGSSSEQLHESIGEAAVLAGCDMIFAYGAKAKAIADGAAKALDKKGGFSEEKVFWYEAGDKEAMTERLTSVLKEGDAVYVKGSRSMKMEDVVKALLGAGDGIV